MKKVYLITNDHNVISRAYTDFASALWFKLQDEKFDIQTIELPFVSRHIHYLDLYLGFDYNFGAENGIYDITNNNSRKYYACKDHTKLDDLWIALKEKAKHDIDNHHIEQNYICSDDYGYTWDYGDSAEGKFHLSIISIRVNKTILKYEQREILKANGFDL